MNTTLVSHLSRGNIVLHKTTVIKHTGLKEWTVGHEHLSVVVRGIQTYTLPPLQYKLEATTNTNNY